MAHIVSLLAVLLLAAVPAAAMCMLAAGLRAWLGERAARSRARGLDLRVAARRDVTADIFWVRLEPAGRRNRLPSFRPGQHVMVQVKDDQCRTMRRAYSLAAWEAHPQSYELAIKREAEGRVSQLLHGSLQQGARLRVARPGGEYHSGLARGHTSVALVAAGIGITPMRAMIAGWSACRQPPQVVLHHTARVRDELLFMQAFRALEREVSWFTYEPRLTRHDAAWDGASGRLNAASVLQGRDDPSGLCVFMCASHAMEEALTEGLVARGVPVAQIHRESFGIEAAATDIQATITTDGRDVAFNGHATLLHALEEAGIGIPADCRAGECGGCRFVIRSGSARHVVSGVEMTETMLACCCVPLSDMTLTSRP